MKLVISEKPSVAQSIAAVIGAKQRGNGYLEGGGHLLLSLERRPIPDRECGAPRASDTGKV